MTSYHTCSYVVRKTEERVKKVGGLKSVYAFYTYVVYICVRFDDIFKQRYSNRQTVKQVTD